MTVSWVIDKFPCLYCLGLIGFGEVMLFNIVFVLPDPSVLVSWLTLFLPLLENLFFNIGVRLASIKFIEVCIFFWDSLGLFFFRVLPFSGEFIDFIIMPFLMFLYLYLIDRFKIVFALLQNLSLFLLSFLLFNLILFLHFHVILQLVFVLFDVFFSFSLFLLLLLFPFYVFFLEFAVCFEFFQLLLSLSLP